MMRGGKFIHRLSRWLDEWKMAFSGVVLATLEWRFLVTFLLAFILFGTLMNLLSSSTATLDLFWATDFNGKVDILGNAFLAIFGINQTFDTWALLFVVTLLQSILIGLVVLVWQKRHRSRKANAVAFAKNANNVGDAGLAAGLAILGSGCPTCGTTLLAPVISTFASSGGFVIAGFVSKLLTFASVLLALFALKRIGKDAFIMITGERYEKRHQLQQTNHLCEEKNE